jgi:deazaflavin-dependent oxidoreductase (nitroreductase family)
MGAEPDAEGTTKAYCAAVDLTDELGMKTKGPNAAQRGMQRLGSTRPGAWGFSKTLRYLDRAVSWASRGRTTAPAVLAGLPVITVTTTGAKTGKKRTSPLVGIPSKGGVAVVGTNFGQARTPGWYHNLRSDPEAEVRYQRVVVPAVAREASGDERDAIITRAEGIYAGFSAYQERIDTREIHVMVLDAP